MLKLENIEVLGWEAAIRGMRNPMNSWEKSDSHVGFGDVFCCDCGCKDMEPCGQNCIDIGSNDHDLMMRLAKGGPVHAKYRRMIAVYVDITAPLYWWKEFDTYKIGTVANSCSTMHKIHVKEFTIDDFSHEHLCTRQSMDVLKDTIGTLNFFRGIYLHGGMAKDEDGNLCGYGKNATQIWWQMIQLLPSSYNQKRTVMMNYEVLANIYKSRRNHKLDEWHTFCDWIEELPYSELITGMEPISHEVVSDSTPLFLRKSMTIPEEWPATTEEASKASEDLSRAIDKIRELDEEEKIEHLVDITCSWDVEELCGERIYAIGPGFTREDLTPYELHLLEKSEEYEQRKKKE